MTGIAIGVLHIKITGFAGQHSLERCEDPRCVVLPDGLAECGRPACPDCGASGSTLTGPEPPSGIAFCACGHTFTVGRAS